MREIVLILRDTPFHSGGLQTFAKNLYYGLLCCGIDSKLCYLRIDGTIGATQGTVITRQDILEMNGKTLLFCDPLLGINHDEKSTLVAELINFWEKVSKNNNCFVCIMDEWCINNCVCKGIANLRAIIPDGRDYLSNLVGQYWSLAGIYDLPFKNFVASGHADKRNICFHNGRFSIAKNIVEMVQYAKFLNGRFICFDNLVDTSFNTEIIKAYSMAQISGYLWPVDDISAAAGLSISKVTLDFSKMSKGMPYTYALLESIVNYCVPIIGESFCPMYFAKQIPSVPEYYEIANEIFANYDSYINVLQTNKQMIEEKHDPAFIAKQYISLL